MLCPLRPGGIAVFGDVARHATVGDRRIRGIRAGEGGVGLEVGIGRAGRRRVRIREG